LAAIEKLSRRHCNVVLIDLASIMEGTVLFLLVGKSPSKTVKMTITGNNLLQNSIKG
jgi:hypothetical protein